MGLPDSGGEGASKILVALVASSFLLVNFPILIYPLTMPTTTTLTAICHQAWWLLGAMSDRRCAGNAVSCGTVVARCREQWRTASHLLAQMERQVQGNEVPRGGLKPQLCFCGDRRLKKIKNVFLLESCLSLICIIGCSAVLPPFQRLSPYQP